MRYAPRRSVHGTQLVGTCPQPQAGAKCRASCPCSCSMMCVSTRSDNHEMQMRRKYIVPAHFVPRFCLFFCFIFFFRQFRGSLASHSWFGHGGDRVAALTSVVQSRLSLFLPSPRPRKRWRADRVRSTKQSTGFETCTRGFQHRDKRTA